MDLNSEDPQDIHFPLILTMKMSAFSTACEPDKLAPCIPTFSTYACMLNCILFSCFSIKHSALPWNYTRFLCTWQVGSYQEGKERGGINWMIGVDIYIGNDNPVLPGKSHGRRSLVGCSPWDLEESVTTEWLHFHFSLLCVGEGNGNPLQCSCLENPRDRGAWWATVYGVAQSRTRLKRLSSSSSNRLGLPWWLKQ